jgi:hypothetical protein
VLDESLALGDVRGRGLLVVELVQHALAARTKALEGDLARDDHHGDAGRVGLLQAGERGQCARPRGEEQDADVAGRAGEAVGGERGVVLHARGDEAEVGAGQRVEQAERVLPGDAEDRRRAEGGERLDHEVAAVALAGDGGGRRGCGAVGDLHQWSSVFGAGGAGVRVSAISVTRS